MIQCQRRHPGDTRQLVSSAWDFAVDRVPLGEAQAMTYNMLTTAIAFDMCDPSFDAAMSQITPLPVGMPAPLGTHRQEIVQPRPEGT